MKLSEKGKAFIQGWEGLRLKAYKDGGGVWTIGWGHTKNVVPHSRIGINEALRLFDEDAKEVEDGVNHLVKVPLTQGQFDALVSFAFNVGLDIDKDTKAEGLGDSALLRLLNKGNYAGAHDEFAKWVYDNRKVVQGLVNRREAEQLLFWS